MQMVVKISIMRKYLYNNINMVCTNLVNEISERK